MSGQGDDGGVTRLGPDSGGRGPGEPTVAYREWSWSADESGRPGLPILGIFLLVFGGLLLLQQLVPGTSLWSWLGLGIGVAALLAYVSRRGRGGSAFLLWLGVILVATGLPSLLIAIGVLPERDGWGTLFLGIALIGLGLVRRSRPGIPLSVWLGGLLALIGLSETALVTSVGDYVVPILVIGLGGIIVLRAVASPRR
jgi:hypothetical protein